ncbi:MAG: hypothetical protein IT381_28095 [Deltaproteobacteria bacterium]|nr:hypothetical protein [Deltaproteobacteria bacterium]
MTRAELEHAIRAAGGISGDRELYIVGSQAILGAFPDAHPELLRSMEVDIAPKNKPELEEVIEGAVGELSIFHSTFGFYIDGVDITAIKLPSGWQARLVAVSNPNTNGYTGLCLEPIDLAISKLYAGREKDVEFVRVMLREALISRADLAARLAVSGFDEPTTRAIAGRVSAGSRT